ncbi:MULTISPECIES: MFS transporter [Arthrobacter]|uniref:MFS transporter n=2 Tax=Arthrobacter TaxID=1663 RepID=A0ABU9KP74_9MICC|nr:MFS transporter [Arthrobacter sp. YJM1]MDP5228729.1 MFS transporter [Arthrobacter sp. YJM1]
MDFLRTPGRARLAFLAGIALVFAGVALHLPMYLMASHMGFMLAGMPMDPLMIVGMVLGAAGLLLCTAALLAPPRKDTGADAQQTVARGVTHTVTDRMQARHWLLVLVLIFAVAIDTQKPFTFSLILPSVAGEYGVSSPGHPVPGAPPVALLPFMGILGTVIGSLLWGILGDRFGRRAAILLAAVLFVYTSVCGAMPDFWGNVAMCFVMGISAGGMLPAAFALLAEIMPTPSRGWLLVLVSGAGTGLGFVIASQAAQLLMPVYSWRILWLMGVGTGAVLLLAGRFIPESPRHLLAHGHRAEALKVLQHYRAPLPVAQPVRTAGLQDVFARPFTGLTSGLVACAAAWGGISFGVLVWLPTNLTRSGGTSVAEINGILAQGALFALPVSAVVAWMYSRWSARRSLLLSTSLTAVVLLAYVIAGDHMAGNRPLLVTLVSLLLVSSWAATAVITPYSAEIYPTGIRARGASVVAGAGKLGGVLALGMSVTGIVPPGIGVSALISLIPMILGVGMLAVYAVETKAQALEAVVVTER